MKIKVGDIYLAKSDDCDFDARDLRWRFKMLEEIYDEHSEKICGYVAVKFGYTDKGYSYMNDYEGLLAVFDFEGYCHNGAFGWQLYSKANVKDKRLLDFL